MFTLQTYPDVTLPGEVALGDPGGVQPGSGDVHGPHQVEPAHLAHSGGLHKALLDGKVHGGHDAAEPQAHEHTWRRETTQQPKDLQL